MEEAEAEGGNRGEELVWRSSEGQEELEVEADVAGAKPLAAKRWRLSGTCCSVLSVRCPEIQ